jgi:hypothetical protein
MINNPITTNNNMNNFIFSVLYDEEEYGEAPNLALYLYLSLSMITGYCCLIDFITSFILSLTESLDIGGGGMVFCGIPIPPAPIPVGKDDEWSLLIGTLIGIPIPVGKDDELFIYVINLTFILFLINI